MENLLVLERASAGKRRPTGLEVAAAEGSMFQLVMHPFVIGYRSRIWILEALIEAA